MELTLSLAKAAILMLIYMVPAFIVRKLNVIGDNLALILSKIMLYITNPFMFIKTSLIEYREGSWKGFLIIFIASLFIHYLTLFITMRLFRNAPDGRRRVLRFATVFANVGNFGIPIIIYTLGYDYAFYVQGCILAFNLVAFSYGRFIYTGDPKHKSPYYAFVNPSSIPLFIGLIIYFTGAGTWIVNHLDAPGALGVCVQMFYDMSTTFSNMVAPVTMMIIGARLADLKLKGMLKDKYMFFFLFLRSFAIPALAWLLTIPLRGFGLLSFEYSALLIIITSTPCASLATAFAELYGGDSVYSSKLTAISTLCAVITMPLVVAVFCH